MNVATLGIAGAIFLASCIWIARAMIWQSGNASRGDQDETVAAAFADAPWAWNADGPFRRVKVMAEYCCDPLWACRGDGYENISPEALGVSASLAADLAAWSRAFDSSYDADDPAVSGWSPDVFESHAAEGRALASRLAQERPDLEVHVWDPASGRAVMIGRDV
jgi:hypothetical protein